MPLIEVMLASDVSSDSVERLAAELPEIVSRAVACREEPFDGDLQPGDVEIRFRTLGPHDVSGIGVCIEVRSKFFESRARNRQDRSDQIQQAVAMALGRDDVGVYLSLPIASWSPE